MIGYKAFNEDLTCKSFQYEIGKTYSIKESPIPCNRGFHFCKSIAETYEFYPMSENTRICKIEALGEIQTDDEKKYCTNVIKIIEEVTDEWNRKGNSNSSNSGYCNSGNSNSGDWNSGDWNSGNRNSGDWNSGDWNSGNRNSGLFNSEENPKLKMFNNMSDWTINDWNDSDARHIMNTCPYTHSDFIDKSDMTDEEKENHPEYKTIGGFVKVFIVTKKEKEDWWNKLSDEDKDIIKSLPNFDFDIFRKCVGF